MPRTTRWFIETNTCNKAACEAALQDAAAYEADPMPMALSLTHGTSPTGNVEEPVFDSMLFVTCDAVQTRSKFFEVEWFREWLHFKIAVSDYD